MSTSPRVVLVHDAAGEAVVVVDVLGGGRQSMGQNGGGQQVGGRSHPQNITERGNMGPSQVFMLLNHTSRKRN